MYYVVYMYVHHIEAVIKAMCQIEPSPAICNINTKNDKYQPLALKDFREP